MARASTRSARGHAVHNFGYAVARQLLNEPHSHSWAHAPCWCRRRAPSGTTSSSGETPQWLSGRVRYSAGRPPGARLGCAPAAVASRAGESAATAPQSAAASKKIRGEFTCAPPERVRFISRFFFCGGRCGDSSCAARAGPGGGNTAPRCCIGTIRKKARYCCFRGSVLNPPPP